MNGVALLTDGFDLTSRSVTDFGNLALRQVATVGTLEEPLADLSTRVVLESAPSQLSQLFVALLSRHECDPGPVVWNFKGIATHDDQVARILFSSLALGQHRATVDELSTELSVEIRVLEFECWKASVGFSTASSMAASLRSILHVSPRTLANPLAFQQLGGT